MTEREGTFAASQIRSIPTCILLIQGWNLISGLLNNVDGAVNRRLRGGYMAN